MNIKVVVVLLNIQMLTCYQHEESKREAATEINWPALAQETCFTSDYNYCFTDNSDYQYELIQTSLTEQLGTRLLLNKRPDKSPNGFQPNLQILNAVNVVRQFLVDVLHLPQLEYKILQAKYFQDEQVFLFEMSAKNDVIEILTHARLFLKNSLFEIQPTTRDFFEIRMYQRFL